MRLICEHLFIKPLSLFELESLQQAIHEGSEFEIAEIDKKDFAFDILKTLEDTFVPSVRNNPADYLLYTIWLIINRDNNKAEGFISLNFNKALKKQIELSYTLFANSEQTLLITESLNAIIPWISENYAFEKYFLHEEFASEYDHIFLQYGFSKKDNGLYNIGI
jgi:hypothetical protein